MFRHSNLPLKTSQETNQFTINSQINNHSVKDRRFTKWLTTIVYNRHCRPTEADEWLSIESPDPLRSYSQTSFCHFSPVFCQIREGGDIKN